MHWKNAFDAVQSVARSAHGLSVFAGAILLLPETERRVNRIYESNKGDLAVRLHNPSIPWNEYDIGSMRRFLLLQRGFGFRPTIRMMRQNAVSDRLKNWSGAERRMARGHIGDRLRDGSGPSIKRATDSPEYSALIHSRISKATYN